MSWAPEAFAARVAAGTCSSCSGRARAGRLKCNRCAKLQRATRKQRTERLAAGLCLTCGAAPAVEQGTECQACSEKRAARAGRMAALEATMRAAAPCGRCSLRGAHECTGSAVEYMRSGTTNLGAAQRGWGEG